MAENPTESIGEAERGKPRTFRIQIDKSHFDLKTPEPSGRDLLVLAGKSPPEQFAIYLKVKGEQPERIALEKTIDLRKPGTERFVTLPLDQTEG